MVTNHHDTGYKELFSHPEFVQQLIEGFAPSEIADLMDFNTLKNHSGMFGVENAGHSWEALQQAVDRVVEIIKADPNKERIDRIITRWIKRHLSRLRAEVGLERLNSLVEDKDMLAENLENLVKKERHEGFAGLLRLQLAFKFGELPSWVEEKLASASDEDLNAWGTRMLTANSLDELFKH